VKGMEKDGVVRWEFCPCRDLPEGLAQELVGRSGGAVRYWVEKNRFYGRAGSSRESDKTMGWVLGFLAARGMGEEW